MANIPNNIVAILGVDNAGAITNIDPNLVFNKQVTTTPTAATIVTAPPKEIKPQQTVVTNNVETTIALSIEALPNNIPVVNSSQDNLENSVIWQSGSKIGVNTRVPRWTIDVNSGSVNISPASTLDGFKIRDTNIAYADFSIMGSEQMILGDDDLLPIVNLNSLIIRGLIPLVATEEDRILFINDLGVVSAKTDIFLESMNGLTNKIQVFAFGSSGTTPNVVSTVVSTVGTHTFNFPLASATGVTAGLISKADYDTFTSRISGSGTINYLPKFTASTAVGNSLIFDNGTGVGISTTTITEKFNVSGYVLATGYKIPSGTASQFLMANGATSTISSLISMITGTGTPNFLSKFTSLGVLIDTIIYDNGTNVTVNGTTGAGRFNVVGTSIFYGNVIIDESSNLSIVQSNTINTPAAGYSVFDVTNYNFDFLANTGGLNYRWFRFDTSNLINQTLTAFTLPASSGTLALLTDIPSLSGYTPNTRTLTINGTTYDLSANRTWSVGTVTSVAALTIDALGTDITSSVATGTTTPVITLSIPTASATNRGVLSSADWVIFNDKLATSRTITINGTTYDLSTDRTWSVGTVTSVAALTIGTTGTDIASSVATGTSTPVITLNIPTASATNRGALSSADWTTFNNKQNALTNPITGSLTTNYIPKATGATTLGNSGIYESGGNVGIGATALTTTNLSVSKGVTGGTIASAVVADGSILSDVTSIGIGFGTFLNTQQLTFTLSSYRHFHANQGAIRTGSVVTNQYGFYANSGLIGATNNHGFFGDIASGTGRWNLYMNGTANNYLAGNLLIKTTTDNGRALQVVGAGNVTSTFTVGVLTGGNRTITLGIGGDIVIKASAGGWVTGTFFQGSAGTGLGGFGAFGGTDALNYFYVGDGHTSNGIRVYPTNNAVLMSGNVGIGASYGSIISLSINKIITGGVSAFGVYQNGTVQSTVTSAAHGFYNQLNTQAATFTLSLYRHFYADNGTLGAGTTINNQYGFIVADLYQASNNFGFFGGVTAGFTKWNLYMNGSAKNYLAGSLLVGSTTDAGYKLDVTGTARISSTLTANSFVKISGTSVQYLMADGNVSTLTDALVTGKLLTGFTTLTGTVSATDTILQAFGKVQAQLNGLSGSLIYKGSWNASTNSPTIVSGTGTNGNYYIVSVAGTTTIDGISSWAVGDWIVFNSTTNTWQKIANQSVTSVNGLTGVVTITTSNIAEGTNLYYTNARAIAATLTGYTSGTGTITSADTILSAIQKLNGNFSLISSIFTGTSAQFVKANGTTSEIVTDLDSDITGTKNSSNTLFTISANFVSNSTRVFINGVRMQRGVGNDYVEVGTNQIQFTTAPDSGDIIVVDYIK